RHTRSKRDWSSDVCSSDLHELMTKGVMEEVRQIFRPEFLNRIDETIVFAVLTQKEVRQIAKLMIEEIAGRLKESHHIPLKVTAEIGRASCREEVKSMAVDV